MLRMPTFSMMISVLTMFVVPSVMSLMPFFMALMPSFAMVFSCVGRVVVQPNEVSVPVFVAPTTVFWIVVRVVHVGHIRVFIVSVVDGIRFNHLDRHWLEIVWIRTGRNTFHRAWLCPTVVGRQVYPGCGEIIGWTDKSSRSRTVVRPPAPI